METGTVKKNYVRVRAGHFIGRSTMKKRGGVDFPGFITLENVCIILSLNLCVYMCVCVMWEMNKKYFCSGKSE